MRKLLFPVSLPAVIGVLFAADFWANKKFTEWSDKEVRKMVTDSPWARPVEVRMGGGGPGGFGGGGGGGGRGGRGGGGGGMPGGGGGGGGGFPGGGGGGDVGGGAEGGGGGGLGRGGGGGGGGFEGGGEVPTMTIQIRWHTALPVRQALARSRFGAEAGTSPEAAKMLAGEQTQYVVGIAGLPAQMLRGNPDVLKQAIQLKIKDKPPIMPSQISGDRGEGGRANLYVIFPKGNGSPVIQLEDNEIEFVAKLGPIEIKRKFRLKDMVFDGKLEL